MILRDLSLQTNKQSKNFYTYQYAGLMHLKACEVAYSGDLGAWCIVHLTRMQVNASLLFCPGILLN